MMLMFRRRDPIKDPTSMAGFELDDYAASWQRRLGLDVGVFVRDRGEPDQAYRIRLLSMIRDSLESPT